MDKQEEWGKVGERARKMYQAGYDEGFRDGKIFVYDERSKDRDTLIDKIEMEICEVPKDPLPRSLKDLETISIAKIDECLKYAGRVNYNKALSDVKQIILETLK